MTKEETLRKLDRELWDLVGKLVSFMIPFNPPPKDTRIMEENNPKGYALLVKYLETLKEYEDLKNG